VCACAYVCVEGIQEGGEEEGDDRGFSLAKNQSKGRKRCILIFCKSNSVSHSSIRSSMEFRF
jgi:hypothetical protein